MTRQLVQRTVDKALQGFDRTKWSDLRLPALIWVDSQTKAFIQVPIYLYSEFGLNPLAMPGDELEIVPYHPPRPGKRAYRKPAGNRLPSRYPKTGNKIRLDLPESSQIFIKRRTGQERVKHISFVVPRHVSSGKVAYFLWNCCDHSKLPYSFQFNRSEVYTDSFIVREGRSVKRHISVRDMTLGDLGVISWIQRLRTQQLTQT